QACISSEHFEVTRASPVSRRSPVSSRRGKEERSTSNDLPFEGHLQEQARTSKLHFQVNDLKVHGDIPIGEHAECLRLLAASWRPKRAWIERALFVALTRSGFDPFEVLRSKKRSITLRQRCITNPRELDMRRLGARMGAYLDRTVFAGRNQATLQDVESLLKKRHPLQGQEHTDEDSCSSLLDFSQISLTICEDYDGSFGSVEDEIQE
ncbi:unnamed protein product, partial [Amoebophrya sp. A25]